MNNHEKNKGTDINSDLEEPAVILNYILTKLRFKNYMQIMPAMVGERIITSISKGENFLKEDATRIIESLEQHVLDFKKSFDQLPAEMKKEESLSVKEIFKTLKGMKAVKEKICSKV